ncbi:hypothetical protein cce_4469 [Crocosphaera subtropica ATCC 51142]|uniref:CHAT domain-containing protein n=1 Tax=Crocosphaera subtropica (strain ATCC 51142 / BH68) TaxID=43989 RepID=B1WUG3_CROS5|nr:tetratricopeptide repeat protein [Crocosphaera subtropica]ACB53817.1 hypothetical protein cce_4469 [Crocosphaera subtropica ATCC 51142]
MKAILSSLITLSICLTPITPILTVQPATAQTENLSEQALQLLQQSIQLGQQDKYQEAIETLQRALGISKKIKNKELEITALLGLGFTYRSINKPTQALDYYEQALSITREVSDYLGEATILINIGFVYNNIDKPTEALDYYKQALPIMRQLGDVLGEATTLNNIALVYSNIGKPTEALNHYEQALLIVREIGDRLKEATTLNNIGLVYNNIGKPTEALDYFNQALPIRRKVGDRSGEATTLNNIALVYNNIGKLTEALDYFNQALLIRREVGDRSGEAATLNNIGAVYWSIGKPTEALGYYEQALPITREVGDRSGEAATLNNIGLLYNNIGQLTEALGYYEQALPIVREVDDRSGEAATLNNIGLLYNNIGQFTKALDYYEQALPIVREVGDRSKEATTLNNIGLVYNNIGKPTKALYYYEQALPIIREVGDHSGEAITLNNMGYVYRDTNYPIKAIKHFEDAVNITLEMRRGLKREDRKTFLKQKENTAIALIKLLIEQNQPEKAFEWANLTTTFDLADYNRLINAQVANPQIQKEIDDWNQKNERLNFLRQQLEEEFSTAKAQQVNELQAELNLQAEAIADQHPEVAELFEIKPTDIAILRENIAPDTAIIQPVILSDKIALFILTSEDVKVITKDIDSDEFNQLITEYRQQLSHYANADVFVTSEKIYDILIRPLESEINTIAPENLAIIATGKLRYIPFETLSDPETGEFLLEKYPIHYLTRISTHAIPPNSTLERGEKTLSALALANPKPTNINLSGTEKEAKHLEDNFPGSEAYLGTDATLQTFKDNASRFPILHLGTHGCFDPDGCPNLGMEANTILFANNEQYNIADAALLGLKNTEILVLSACQTAKEANANGRELSGLAFVLERAGAKTVMASLWNAEDDTSANIMTNFYTNMKQGMSKNEAMQLAKLNYLETGEYDHPYFWSPFILIGNN